MSLLLSLCILLVVLLLLVVVHGNNPVRNIHVTLRGKKHNVKEAVTVRDVLDQIMGSDETSKKKNNNNNNVKVLFGGKQLGLDDPLEQAGVREGDSLQAFPQKKKKSSSSTVASTPPETTTTTTTTTTPPANTNWEEMAKSMLPGGNDGGGGGSMPDMTESIDMMTSMMNSPMFQEYMSDPEKLEASRQMILKNPMMKQMLAGMPGMQEILESPEAWREAMTMAANMYQNTDPEELKRAMMQNMPPGANMQGLFPNNNNNALDELSEDDEE